VADAVIKAHDHSLHYILGVKEGDHPHGFLIKNLPASATLQTYAGSQQSLQVLPEN
jgi:hypothetical protein